MPRSILASLTGLGSDKTVMETAIAAAQTDGGHITCLHARIDIAETAATMEVAFPQYRRGENIILQVSHEEDEREAHARAAYDDAIKRHSIPQCDTPTGEASITACWKETKSFFNETLEEARYHDLTVTARDSELSLERIKSILAQSGRPLLLAPPKCLPTVGRKIVIAWKDGPEAARAVTVVSPWLAQAEKVIIITASRNPDCNDRDRLLLERLAKCLLPHGIKAEIYVAYSASNSEAQILKNKAYDEDADLLVMGAYGYSRLREFILGGVTEDMLADCAIPLLMFK
jgi:nucleotide-binding universal stress UspA family protein